MNKYQIRKSVRQIRNSLSGRQVKRYSAAALAHLVRTRIFKQSRRIGFYYPYDNELDPLGLLACPMAKQYFLPVIRRFPRFSMTFSPWSRRLRPNRFGIMEPAAALWQAVPVRALDLLVVPAVALDREGGRLGFGMGFYDRCLSYRHHRHHWQKPLLLGLVYDFQLYDKLPLEPWDIQLDWVVTESGVFKTK